MGTLLGGFLANHMPRLFGYQLLALFAISSFSRIIVSTILLRRVKEIRKLLIRSLLIFILTYTIISAQKMKWHKLDRPSGRCWGCTDGTVRVLTLDEAYRAVDFNTILLLLGMMLIIAYLKIANCFKYLSYLLITHARNSFLLLCLYPSPAASYLHSL